MMYELEDSLAKTEVTLPLSDVPSPLALVISLHKYGTLTTIFEDEIFLTVRSFNQIPSVT